MPISPAIPSSTNIQKDQDSGINERFPSTSVTPQSPPDSNPSCASQTPSHETDNYRDFSIHSIMAIPSVTPSRSSYIYQQPPRFEGSGYVVGTYPSFHICQPYQYPRNFSLGSTPNVGGQLTRSPTDSLSPTSFDFNSASSKIRRSRPTFEPFQIEALEFAFNKNSYVYGSERLALASAVRMSEKQVKIWFQNRRSKMKKFPLIINNH